MLEFSPVWKFPREEASWRLLAARIQRKSWKLSYSFVSGLPWYWDAFVSTCYFVSTQNGAFEEFGAVLELLKGSIGFYCNKSAAWLPKHWKWLTFKGRMLCLNPISIHISLPSPLSNGSLAVWFWHVFTCFCWVWAAVWSVYIFIPGWMAASKK